MGIVMSENDPEMKNYQFGNHTCRVNAKMGL